MKDVEVEVEMSELNDESLKKESVEMIEYLKDYVSGKYSSVFAVNKDSLGYFFESPKLKGIKPNYIGVEIEKVYGRSYSFRSRIVGVEIYFTDRYFHKVKRVVKADKWNDEKGKEIIKKKLEERFDDLVGLFFKDADKLIEEREKAEQEDIIRKQLNAALEQKGYEGANVSFVWGKVSMNIVYLSLDEAKRLIEALPVRQKEEVQ